MKRQPVRLLPGGGHTNDDDDAFDIQCKAEQSHDQICDGEVKKVNRMEAAAQKSLVKKMKIQSSNTKNRENSNN